MEKLLLVENFLDHGIICACGKIVNCGKIAACEKLL